MEVADFPETWQRIDFLESILEVRGIVPTHFLNCIFLFLSVSAMGPTSAFT